MNTTPKIRSLVAVPVLALTLLVAQNAAAATKNVIPIRFVQPLDCQPGPGCADNVPYLMLQDSVRRANEVYADAGIKFWIKSNERYYLPQFHNKNRSLYSWQQVKGAGSTVGLTDVFPKMPLDAYDNVLDIKEAVIWQKAATALYGDPDEILVWVMDSGDITQSNGDFPHGGRSLYIVANNLWKNFGTPPEAQATTHLAHELGHFFGLRHPWDANHMVNPATGQTWTYAEQWDQLYCETGAWPVFYTSSQDYINQGCSGTLRRIARDADYCGTNGNPYGAVYCQIGPYVYWAGNDEMKGISVVSGDGYHPPESFAWSINVMTYYSTWGVDLRAPAYIPDSQIKMVRAYVTYDLDFHQDTVDQIVRYNGTMPNQSTAAGLTSQRSKLGKAEEDFLWWANGDLSFASQTKPISGTGYEPASGDLDGDGFDDIFWYYPPTGRANIWWSNGNRSFSSQNHVPFATNAKVLIGDFDGSGADDIYMYRPGTGADYIFWSNGDGTFTVTQKNVNGHYNPVVGDFDNAHGDDIAWYYPAGGYANFWWSDGDKTFTGQNWVPVGDGEAYIPIVGNFDDQHGDDIFWYRSGSGADLVWFSVSAQFFVDHLVQNVRGTYLPISGDFAGDGPDDIFWDAVYHTTDYIWTGTGDQLSPFDSSHTASVFGSFKPIAGDYDGDQATDIFWYRKN